MAGLPMSMDEARSSCARASLASPRACASSASWAWTCARSGGRRRPYHSTSSSRSRLVEVPRATLGVGERDAGRAHHVLVGRGRHLGGDLDGLTEQGDRRLGGLEAPHVDVGGFAEERELAGRVGLVARPRDQRLGEGRPRLTAAEHLREQTARLSRRR